MISAGAAARKKGHLAEKNVAAWLRDHGWPDAATTRSRLGSDGTRQAGDITGGPVGLLLEVKDRAQAAWPAWCRKAADEASTYGLLHWCVVRKTARVGDPGRWTCVTSLPGIDADAVLGGGTQLGRAVTLHDRQRDTYRIDITGRPVVICDFAHIIEKKNLVERLRVGRARIARGWCQGHYATDDGGHWVSPDAPGATHWCARGALLDVAGYGGLAVQALCSTAMLPGPLAWWNDRPGRTQAEVLALYDEAIANSTEQETL